MDEVGTQLTSEELHTRQQAQTVSLLAPFVVAVGITDKNNVGTIFRVCDAVKCNGLALVNEDPFYDSPKFRRASRSTHKTVPYQVFSSLESFIQTLPSFPPLIALEITTNSSDLYQTTLPQAMALVVGSERHGIPETLLKHCQMAVHLPMFGINSSMNVATALGITLYEWHRRFR